MNILIIEDDKLILHSIKYTIESLGHTVSEAENAEKAVEKISSEKFDLVFSDLMMPGISGLSLVSIFRTVYHFEAPIIAMSTLHNQPLLQAIYKAGANDFMVKPFTPTDVADKINKFSDGREYKQA